MADTLPYSTRNNEHAIVNSIRSGESPANASTMTVPVFIRDILEACWQQDPADRCDMRLCWTVLSYQLSPFELFAMAPLSEIPRRYKSQNGGWIIIRNPVLEHERKYELMPRIVRNVM